MSQKEEKKKDVDLNDIDNPTLDKIIYNSPNPKLPDPENNKQKHVLNKLNNISAEKIFIGSNCLKDGTSREIILFSFG